MDFSGRPGCGLGRCRLYSFQPSLGSWSALGLSGSWVVGEWKARLPGTLTRGQPPGVVTSGLLGCCLTSKAATWAVVPVLRGGLSFCHVAGGQQEPEEFRSPSGDVFNHWFCGFWLLAQLCLGAGPGPDTFSPGPSAVCLCRALPLGGPRCMLVVHPGGGSWAHGGRDQPRAHAWEAGAGPQICCSELLPRERGRACFRCVPKPR